MIGTFQNDTYLIDRPSQDLQTTFERSQMSLSRVQTLSLLIVLQECQTSSIYKEIQLLLSIRKTLIKISENSLILLKIHWWTLLNQQIWWIFKHMTGYLKTTIILMTSWHLLKSLNSFHWILFNIKLIKKWNLKSLKKSWSNCKEGKVKNNLNRKRSSEFKNWRSLKENANM